LPRAVENLRRLSPLYQQAQTERACRHETVGATSNG
jgi:hypothetical protein